MNRKIWLHYRNPKDYNFKIMVLQTKTKEKMKAVAMANDSGFNYALRKKALSIYRAQIQNSNKMKNSLNNVCIWASPSLLSP